MIEDGSVALFLLPIQKRHDFIDRGSMRIESIAKLGRIAQHITAIVKCGQIHLSSLPQPRSLAPQPSIEIPSSGGCTGLHGRPRAEILLQSAVVGRSHVITILIARLATLA